ncbi:MAG: hypothetical protein OXC40_07820 [Proteobacteria bacterium]|nr:hypothetical protein [Pseudomonadota bacterium]
MRFLLSRMTLYYYAMISFSILLATSCMRPSDSSDLGQLSTYGGKEYQKFQDLPPYFVELGTVKPSIRSADSKFHGHCSAAHIGDGYILTAAQCLDNFLCSEQKGMLESLALRYISKTESGLLQEQTVGHDKIQSVAMHKDFFFHFGQPNPKFSAGFVRFLRPYALTHDIALIKVNVDPATPFAGQASLPKKQERDFYSSQRVTGTLHLHGAGKEYSPEYLEYLEQQKQREIEMWPEYQKFRTEQTKLKEKMRTTTSAPERAALVVLMAANRDIFGNTANPYDGFQKKYKVGKYAPPFEGKKRPTSYFGGSVQVVSQNSEILRGFERALREFEERHTDYFSRSFNWDWWQHASQNGHWSDWLESGGTKSYVTERFTENSYKFTCYKTKEISPQTFMLSVDDSDDSTTTQQDKFSYLSAPVEVYSNYLSELEELGLSSPSDELINKYSAKMAKAIVGLEPKRIHRARDWLITATSGPEDDPDRVKKICGGDAGGALVKQLNRESPIRHLGISSFALTPSGWVSSRGALLSDFKRCATVTYFVSTFAHLDWIDAAKNSMAAGQHDYQQYILDLTSASSETSEE